MKKVTVIHAAFEETPVTVAEVNLPWEVISEATDANQCLEYAYRWTNNIQGSWSRDKILTGDNGETINNGDYNDDVKVLTPLHVSKNTGQEMGLRSTSMGDMMEFDGKKYKVAGFGFKEIV